MPGSNETQNRYPKMAFMTRIEACHSHIALYFRAQNICTSNHQSVQVAGIVQSFN